MCLVVQTLDVIEFNVFSKITEGMTVSVTEKVKIGDIYKN